MMNWLLAGLLSGIAGMLYVMFLTVHPLRMSRYLLATCTALFALDRGPGSEVQRRAAVAGSNGLSLLVFLGGFLLMARIVLSRDDERPVPALTRTANDPGLGHTAVIYFTHGEPETYDPIGWINQFREFDKQKIPFVPLIARPFFLYNLRKRYLKVGMSEHRMTPHKMIQFLERLFREEGDDSTRFYLSFLDDNPRPDAALIQALNEGASQVVVSEVFLTVSNHTAEGEEQIESVVQQGTQLANEAESLANEVRQNRAARLDPEGPADEKKYKQIPVVQETGELKIVRPETPSKTASFADAIKVIMDTEWRAYEFYKMAVGSAADAKEQEMFTILAKVELSHYELFRTEYNYTTEAIIRFASEDIPWMMEVS